VVIVYQQHAPMIRNRGIRFPMNRSILTVPIPLNWSFNRVQVDGKHRALIFSGALHPDVSTVGID
jgi:hypothetical protein